MVVIKDFFIYLQKEVFSVISNRIWLLINNCTTVWTTINGVNGRLFTSNFNGATLFLPAAGGRLSEPGNVGSYGYYWSRSLHFASPFCADILQFSSSNDMAVDGSYRLIGYTVRAVRVTQ